MDKKVAGLLGALTALSGSGVANAEPAQAPAAPDVMEVRSYADLLQPIPNALALLKASDEKLKAQAASEENTNVELAQYYYHHHHHHHWYRHHHHHNWYHHHHHHWYHHHHHHNYY